MTTSYIFTSKNVAPDKPDTFRSEVNHIEYPVDDDYEHVLEMIYSACNRGSGKEDPNFCKSGVPSLSVGDHVHLINENVTYRCDHCGWSQL